MMADAGALSPETVMRQMKQNGVTDIVWLPDSETNWLFLLMQADPDLRLVGVTREGHACSIAAVPSAAPAVVASNAPTATSPAPPVATASTPSPMPTATL